MPAIAPHLPTAPARCGAPVVQIAGPGERTGTEGFIDGIAHAAGQVHVRLLLDDGRRAESRLDRLSAEWLDLRDGDIVPVRLPA